jgi:hypothetical protein
MSQRALSIHLEQSDDRSRFSGRNEQRLSLFLRTAMCFAVDQHSEEDQFVQCEKDETSCVVRSIFESLIVSVSIFCNTQLLRTIMVTLVLCVRRLDMYADDEQHYLSESNTRILEGDSHVSQGREVCFFLICSSFTTCFHLLHLAIFLIHCGVMKP